MNLLELEIMSFWAFLVSFRLQLFFLDCRGPTTRFGFLVVMAETHYIHYQPVDDADNCLLISLFSCGRRLVVEQTTA